MVPYIGRKLFRLQESKAAEGNSKPSLEKENTLVDLVSSWDSSAQTAPGIQSFIKDESQILQPVRPGEEAAEEEKRTEDNSVLEDLYSVPQRKAERVKSQGGGKTYVKKLSEIFEEKAAATLESSPVHATAVDGTERASSSKSPPKSPVKSPPKSPAKSPPKSPAKSPPKSPAKSPSRSPEPKPLPPLPTAETPATTPSASSAAVDYDYPPDEECLYQALYDYTATDNTELTIREGDMVISVAGFTAGMSPGWLMVRHEGELDEGWVPESYLKKLGPVYEPEPTSGSGLSSTGQTEVVPPENQNPICKLCTCAVLSIEYCCLYTCMKLLCLT